MPVLKNHCITHHKSTFVGVSLGLCPYYFPEYENPRNETVYDSFG